MINTRLIEADVMLHTLGVPLNFKKEFFFSIKIAVFWIVYLLFINISMVSIYREYDLFLRTFVAIVIQHAYYVNLIIDLSFYLLINHMKVRFKNINKILIDILQLQSNNSMHKEETDYKWAISRKISFEKDFTEIIRKLK